MTTWTDKQAAKNPEAWVAAENAAAAKYRPSRSVELVSIDGETKTGRKRFTYRVTDTRA